MAAKKISALTAASTPLAGTEVLPIVQSGATVKVSVADLTNGRAVATAGGSFTDNITQSTAAKGVNFTANTPAAGMTSQLLNWYEEGTFTPVLSFGGASVGIAYGTQTGKYTRIGNRVFFNMIIILTNQGSSAGGASISGLPFTAAEGVPCSTLINNMGTATATDTQSFANGNVIDLYYQSLGTNAQYTNGNFTNTSQIYISGCYRV